MAHSLPPHSHFRRAVADDDDLQRQIEQQAAPARSRPRGPSLRDWTADDELRATLTDGFHLVQQAIGASVTPKGKSPPKFRPTRRPLTAADRAKRRREQETHAEIVAAVLPQGR